MESNIPFRIAPHPQDGVGCVTPLVAILCNISLQGFPNLARLMLSWLRALPVQIANSIWAERMGLLFGKHSVRGMEARWCSPPTTKGKGKRNG